MSYFSQPRLSISDRINYHSGNRTSFGTTYRIKTAYQILVQSGSSYHRRYFGFFGPYYAGGDLKKSVLIG